MIHINLNGDKTMQLTEMRIEQGFDNKNEFDRAWFGLVEEIVDLEDHLTMEQASGDDGAIPGIFDLQIQLDHKRQLLKKMDLEGLC